MLVRGRADDGADLVISRDYISHGFRARAAERVTLELGPRSEQEIRAGLENEVNAERWTNLDRSAGSALVASGDRDSFQLTSQDTTILYPLRGGEVARIGPENVRQRYGVDPKQVPDFIELRGDPSDKLPGAAGVGPKRAAQLVRRYGTLNGVFEAGLLQAQAKMLRLFRLIATMNASAPLPSLSDQSPTWVSASSLARSWG